MTNKQAGNTLSGTDRRYYMSQLEDSYEQYFNGSCNRDVTLDYYLVVRIASAMERLGLTSFRGRRLSLWRGLRNYLGRVRFTRNLELNAQADQDDCLLGFDGGLPWQNRLPVLPSNLSLRFSLTDIRRRMSLTYDISLWHSSQELFTLSKAEFVARMEPVAGSYVFGRGELKVHFSGSGRAIGCKQCGLWCTSSHKVGGAERLRAAYDEGGVAQVWRAFDWVCSQQLMARPLVRPLSQQALKLRCEAHAGRPVRIVTFDGDFVGQLQRFNDRPLDMDRILAVLLRPKEVSNYGEARSTIPRPMMFYPENIKEIVPCRPEMEISPSMFV